MTRTFTAAVFLLCALIAAPHGAAQTPAPLTYDITIIKPHKATADDNSMWRTHDDTFTADNARLLDLIANAYNVRSWLVFGLPPWAESARYDIQAKISDADANALKSITGEQRRTMLAVILKDRFGLQVHQEDKVQPVYELSVATDGPRLKETPALSEPTADNPRPERKQSWPERKQSWWTTPGSMTATSTPVSTLAQNLSFWVERVVIDKTNLTGLYDLDFKWTPENQQGIAKDNGLAADAPPDIFTALKQQLGLKLTPAKAPVPTIVIDHIDPPEPN